MRGRAALLCLACAGCGTSIGEAGSWTPASESSQPPDPAAPGETIRVVTFNVELGADTEILADSIATHPDLRRADVLLLQEIESHPSEGASRAARLAGALGMGYAYAAARDVPGGTHGLAILSRLPMTDIEVMELPRVDLAIRPRRRIALAAAIAGIRMINVHLDTRINITDRILQLRPAIIDEPTPTLVAGDFNTNPYHWTAGLIPNLPAHAAADTDQAALLDDYMRAAGYDTPTATSGTTQDAIIRRLRLDAIYTRGLDTGTSSVADDIDVSDHLPLWLDIQVGDGLDTLTL